MKVLLSFFLLMFCYALQAQQWFASGQIASGGSVTTDKILIGEDRNSYVSGMFTSSIFTKNGQINANGQADIFLTKRDDSFNEIWTITIGGAGGRNAYTKIALTNDGVLLVGAFVGSCKFGDGTTLDAVPGNRDAFLAKYDLDGNLKWVTHIASGVFTDVAVEVYVANDGTIITSGRSTAAIKFIGENESATVGAAGYIAKFDNSGTRLWYSTISNIVSTAGIVSSNSGYVLGGVANGEQKIIDSKKNEYSIKNSFLTSNYFYLIFYDSEGSYIRSTIGEGLTSTDQVQLLDLTNYGSSIFMGGTYAGSGIQIDESNISVPSSSLRDIFLLKFDPSNDDIISNSISSSGNEVFSDINIKEDFLYVAGQLANTAIFNKDTLLSGMFVAAYQLSSDKIEPIGANKGISGSSSAAKGIDFTLNGFKLAGIFSGTIDIEGSEYTSVGTGTFLAKGALITTGDAIVHDVTGFKASAANGSLDVTIRGLLPDSKFFVEVISAEEGPIKTVNNQSSFTVDQLKAGVYTLKLKYNDEHSYRTYHYTISAPDAFSVDHTEIVHAVCGDNTSLGSIELTVTKPAGYQVRYSAKETTASLYSEMQIDNPRFDNCPAGDYEIKAELLDQGSGVLDTTYTVSVLFGTTGFTVDAVKNTGYLCNRKNSPGDIGIIDVTLSASSTSNDKLFLIDVVTGATVKEEDLSDGITQFSFDNLAPGKYKVMWSSNNCVAVSNEVDLSEPKAVIISSIDAISVDCIGNNNGRITVTASGGTAPLTYSLYESVGGQLGAPRGVDATTPTFSNLEANEYMVEVKDVNGCSVQKTAIIISEGYKIAVELINKKDACTSENNGWFAVKATGGPSTSYSYYLYESDMVPGPPTNVTGSFYNLSANKYSVQAVDQVYGCLATLTGVPIDRLQPITFNVDKTPVLCHGENTGVITLTDIEGGSGSDYTVTVTDGTITRIVSAAPYTVSGLRAGIYTVTVDDNYCSPGVDNVEIKEPPEAVTIDEPVRDPVKCNGESNGSITVVASGGMGTIKYTLFNSSDDTVVQEDNYNGIFSNLVAGTYYVTATDANGCSDTRWNIQINEPPLIKFTQTQGIDVKCFGGSDGSIQVSAEGGKGSLVYSISSDPQQYRSEGLFSGLTEGTYTITAKDDNGCEQHSVGIPVGQPERLVISAATQTKLVSCKPDNDGIITVAADGGVGNYQYGAGVTDVTAYIGASEIGGLSEATYQVKVKDGNGCISDASMVTVRKAGDPVLSESIAPDIQCFGDEGRITIIAVADNLSGSTLNTMSSYWIKGTGDTHYDETLHTSVNTFTELNRGTYKLSAEDSYGCIGTQDMPLAAPTEAIGLEVKEHEDVYGSKKGSIVVQPSGGWLEYTITCYPTSSMIAVDEQTGNDTRTYEFLNLEADDYKIVSVDAKGCQIHAMQPIKMATSELGLEANSLKIFPNPSRDGQFIIEWGTTEDRTVTLEVFDMSGKRVHKTKEQIGTSVRTSLDISNGSRGTYLLHVPELDITRRLVIE